MALRSMAWTKIAPNSHRRLELSARQRHRRCLTTGTCNKEKRSFGWLDWYSERLSSHPLITKGITSGFIAGSGDIICQCISNNSNDDDDDDKKNNAWDVWRTGRFVLLGSVWVAPVTHFWYQTLSTRIIPGGRSTTKVLQRLVTDQFGFAPLFVPSFIAGLWILEDYFTPPSTVDAPMPPENNYNVNRKSIPERLVEVTPSVIQANWTLWIPAQVINFAVIPLNYQVLFSNVVALVWNLYVSWVSTKRPTFQKSELEKQNS